MKEHNHCNTPANNFLFSKIKTMPFFPFYSSTMQIQSPFRKLHGQHVSKHQTSFFKITHEPCSVPGQTTGKN